MFIAELRALPEFRHQGVITAEDFEAKKRQLLGLDRNGTSHGGD